MSQDLILAEFKRILRENQTCIDELVESIKQSKANGIFPNKLYKETISAKEKKVKLLIKFKNYLEKHNLSLDYLDQVYSTEEPSQTTESVLEKEDQDLNENSQQPDNKKVINQSTKFRSWCYSLIPSYCHILFKNPTTIQSEIEVSVSKLTRPPPLISV